MRALLVLLVLAACGSGADGPVARRSSVTVRVDRRIELASLVQRLAKSPAFLTAPASAYVQELDRVFGKHAAHPAVKLARERGTEPAALFELALGEASPAELRAFAGATEFDAFFDRHAPLYARISDTLRTVVESGDPIAWFEQALGTRDRPAFTVVPALAAGAQSHVVRVGREVYLVIGVRRPDGMVATDDDTVAQIIEGLARAYVADPDAARALTARYLRDRGLRQRGKP